MEFLTQKELKEMFSLALKRIRENEKEINKINVFPVPDQDTGTNLKKTLEGTKEVLLKDFPSLEEFSKEIVEKTLISAQGNAGVIFCGFLLGFLEEAKGEKISSQDFVKFFKKGSERAKKSISDPKEGTILDVIEAAANSFEKEIEKEKDFLKLFEKAIASAREALILTREKREIYKKANVVDAGGLGFLIILEAFLEALGKESKVKFKKEMERAKSFFQVISHRFEVVALLSQVKKSESEIKKILENLGNSLEVVSFGQKLKVHIHTDFPEEVKKELEKMGKIEDLKVEDMAKQILSFEEKKLSLGIVTENVATLSEKIIEKYQIELAQVKFEWEALEKFEGKNIWEKMRNAKEKIKEGPKTSQATPFEYLKAFQKQLQKFDWVLCLCLSSKLSGCYNSALQAKEMLSEKERERVFVVDTLLAACGQALLVLRAIELAKEKENIEDLIEKLKELIPKIKFFLFPKTAKFLASIGRISESQAKWFERVKKLGIFPALQFKDGKIEKGGVVFAKNEVEAAFKKVKKEAKGKKIRAIICHCDNEILGKELKEKLKKIGAEIPFVSMGPEIFALLGPDSLLVAFHELEN